jgi:hypothetical protein
MVDKSSGTGPDICCRYDALLVWHHRKKREREKERNNVAI